MENITERVLTPLMGKRFMVPCAETTFFMNSLSENELKNANSTIVDRLYKLAIQQHSQIDTSSFRSCMGDITRYAQYQTLRDTLDLLESVRVKSGNLSFPELETVRTALKNLEDYKMDFAKPISQKDDLSVLIFNSVALGIIQSTAILIDATVELVKRPNDDAFDIVINDISRLRKNEMQVITNLSQFNATVTSGELKKLLVARTKKEAFVGTAIITTVSLIGLAYGIVAVARELIYQFYVARINLSEYFAFQAKLLEVNAIKIEYDSSRDAKKRKQIASKQKDTAEQLLKLSNNIGVKTAKGNVEAKKLIEKEKFTVQDIKSDLDGGSLLL